MSGQANPSGRELHEAGPLLLRPDHPPWPGLPFSRGAQRRMQADYLVQDAFLLLWYIYQQDVPAMVKFFLESPEIHVRLMYTYQSAFPGAKAQHHHSGTRTYLCRVSLEAR